MFACSSREAKRTSCSWQEIGIGTAKSQSGSLRVEEVPNRLDEGANLVNSKSSEENKHNKGAHDLKITEFEAQKRGFEAR